MCPELQEPRHKPALTHVVVVAARFGQFPKANRTLDTVRRIVSSQAAVLRRVLPKGSSTVLFVDNATPSLAGDVLREECARHGLRYARNDEWSAGYGYELGAWRWAVLKVLPTFDLATDAIVYLMQAAHAPGCNHRRPACNHVHPGCTLRGCLSPCVSAQDSMTLERWPLRYPPPASFRAASLLSFAPEEPPTLAPTLAPNPSPNTNPNPKPNPNSDQHAARAQLSPRPHLPPHQEASILGIDQGAEAQRSAWVGDTSAALRLVEQADPAAPATTARFSGCYGPGLVATWGAASELGRRGFFSMMRIRAKLEEQRSERVIGWFLTHDVGEPCSVAGPAHQSVDRWPRVRGTSAYNATRRPLGERPISKWLLGRGWG